MRLEAAFDEFFETIALGSLPEGRIESAWRRLHEFLVKEAEVEGDDIFLQGSYANDTAVQPPDVSGEYDLDVCATVSDADMHPDQAFNYLQGLLERDGDYAKRIETDSQTCVRLRYADDETGRFHIDIVAARAHPVEHLEIPLRGNGWKQTAPRAYTAWCLSLGDQFKRTVRMLKRWRDVNADERRGVSSIILQVLAAQKLPNTRDDATALQSTLVGIRELVNAHPNEPPEVLNPVLPSENLAAGWADTNYELFREQINQAAELATQALDSGDVEESHILWGDLLGDSFPPPPTDPVDRKRTPPETPAPGYEKGRQRAPRRERYG